MLHNLNKYIMDEFPVYTLQQLLPAKHLYKKGQYYTNFYFLTEGTARVTINQIAIDITAPILIGDYQILHQIDYRTSEIKTVTPCFFKVIPSHHYKKPETLSTLDTCFKTLGVKNRLLRYWLTKLFQISICHKNEQSGCEDSIGIILNGQFIINRNILIKNIKPKNLQVLRKFQLCLIAPYQIFQGTITCENAKGIVAICPKIYAKQLEQKFSEFTNILKLISTKKEFHNHLSKDIARSCQNKPKLFDHMIPPSLKNHNHKDEQQTSSTSQLKQKQPSPLRGLTSNKEDLFSVKDNISQFLHRQWRHVMDKHLKHKQRMSLNISSHSITSSKSPRLNKLSVCQSSQAVNLTIPKQFQQQKFKMKMLMKTRDPMGKLGYGRIKTQSNEQKHKKKKLIFT